MGSDNEEHLINKKKKGIDAVPVYISLYVIRSPTTLEGFTGTYVDDCLNAGTEEFEQLTKLTLTEFSFQTKSLQ